MTFEEDPRMYLLVTWIETESNNKHKMILKNIVHKFLVRLIGYSFSQMLKQAYYILILDTENKNII